MTGRTEDTVPEYALLNYRYEQNMEVDYRLDRVIREVVEGPMPELAVNVRVRWEDGPGIARLVFVPGYAFDAAC